MYWDEFVGEAVSSAYWDVLTSEARTAGDNEAASLQRHGEVGSPPGEEQSDDNDDDNGDDGDDNTDRPDTGGLPVPDELKRYDPQKKKFLSVLHSVGPKLYEKSSADVKKKVADEVEARYQQRLEAFNKVRKPVCEYSPDDYLV